jgi:hypothetical protein
MDPRLLKHVDPETLRQLATNDYGEDFDENGTLRDGRRYRVPVSLIDGVPRTADGRQVASHRAGWRLAGSLATDGKMEERARIYREYDAALESEYTGFGSAPSTQLRSSQPGDLCTVRGPEYPWAFGSAGHLDKNLVCVPDADPRRRADARPKDSKDVKALRDAEYARYENEISQAWKGPILDHTPGNKPRRNAGRVLHDTKAAAIADYDAEISQAWRSGK